MASTQALGRDGATLRVWGWDGSSLGVAGLGGADPLGFAAGDANLYRYVGNDPIDQVDPSGLMAGGQGKRLVSTPQAINNAIQTGNKAYIEALLDLQAKTGGLAPDAVAALENALAQINAAEAAAAAAAAEAAAAARLQQTAAQIIANECKGSIHRVFPKELLGKTLAEITKLGKQGNKAAQTALKLLRENRFKK